MFSREGFFFFFPFSFQTLPASLTIAVLSLFERGREGQSGDCPPGSGLGGDLFLMGSWSQHFLPGKEHSTGAPSAIGLGYVFFHEFHRLRKTKQREGSQGMGCTFFGSMPLRKALGRVNICPPPLNR